MSWVFATISARTLSLRSRSSNILLSSVRSGSRSEQVRSPRWGDSAGSSPSSSSSTSSFSRQPPPPRHRWPPAALLEASSWSKTLSNQGNCPTDSGSPRIRSLRLGQCWLYITGGWEHMKSMVATTTTWGCLVNLTKTTFPQSTVSEAPHTQTRPTLQVSTTRWGVANQARSLL